VTSTHPYEAYIEKKAEEYYTQQAHEPFCEVLNPPGPPTDSNGFVYDVYVFPHCDCWLTENLDNLTTERKFEALRNLSHRFNLHSPVCGLHRKTAIVYRNRPQTMTGWCNCWLSVDTPKETEYTEPMTTEFYILPLEGEPNFFDKGRTYPTRQAAIDMLAYQGYSVLAHDPGYWGNSLKIVQRVDTTPPPAPAGPFEAPAPDPNLARIKDKVDQVRANALGPHLDTPIYDQLAREYDEKFNTTSYFDTALAKKLEQIGKRYR